MGYKYIINHDYFKEIDTEYKAYILGFIFADGSVYQPPKNRQLNFRIGIQEEDAYILKELSENAAGGYWRNKQVPSHKKANYKKLVLVNICSNTLCSDLINWGCKINKSKTGIDFPEIEQNLKKHFIRGFLDGDGSIIIKQQTYKYVRKTSYNLKNPHKKRQKLVIAFSCTDKMFLLKIAEILNLNKIYIAERKRKQIIYTLWIENKKETKKVIDFLYTDSNYFLKRKFNKIIEFNKTIKSEAEDTSSERLETT